MSEQKNLKTLKLTIHQVQELACGWQQWLLTTNSEFNILPGHFFQFNGKPLFILWQPSELNFLCLACSNLVDAVKSKDIEVILVGTPQNLDAPIELSMDADKAKEVYPHHLYQSRHLMLCKNWGLFSAIHQLYRWKLLGVDLNQVVLLSESLKQWPMPLKPSTIFCHFMPAQAIGSIELLEDWKILARFCSSTGKAGCFDGELLQFKQQLLLQTSERDWRISCWS